MTRGRPPLPVEVKRRRGTLRPDRLPAGAPLAALSELDVEVVAWPPERIIDRVVAEAVWLAPTDALAVVLLREALEERAELRVDVLAGKGKRADLRALDKQILAQLASLGFDPTARARLGVAEVKRASKIEELRAARRHPKVTR